MASQAGAFNGKLISGAVADTPAGFTVHRIVLTVVGAGSSTISLYNGAVSGTAFLVIPGTTVGNFEINAFCAAGAHIKTVDSGGAMRATVLYK
jgi:hypothetical protein